MLAKGMWAMAARADDAGVRAEVFNAAHETDAGGADKRGSCEKRDK